jgi:aminotransferase
MNLENLINEDVVGLKSTIGMMMRKASKIPGAVSLGQGIPAETLPEYVLADIKEVIAKNEFNKYSPMAGLPIFRAEVAEHLTSKYPKHQIDPEKNVLITCGAAEACAISLAAVLKKGDEVVLFSPCYPSHIDHIKLSGGVPVFVPLNEEDNWSIDTDALASAITEKTRAIIVCNPSNPTGGVFTRKDIEAILDIVQNRDIFILNDETYNYLIYENAEFCSLLDVVTEPSDQIINCFSFSKEFAMTGLRVGYMYVSEKMLEQILKVHITMTICSPTLSQQIGSVMLKHKDKWIGPYLEEFARKRAILLEELDKGREFFSFNPPLGAYYLFLKYNADMPSMDLAVKLLEEAGVVTIPGVGFGSAGEGHVRLSFAATEDAIVQGSRKMIDWFASV